MKKLELEKMAQINGGKMFGYDESCSPCVGAIGSQTKVCRITTTVFWIPFTSTDIYACE